MSPTAAERTQYMTYLDTDLVSGVVVPSVFNAANPTHVDERVRGVLYILAQHPAYTVR